MRGRMLPDRESLRSAAQALVRRVAHRAGMAAVKADYYSPLVDPEALSPEVWNRPEPMPGLELNLDAQLAMIEQRLVPLIAEFAPAEGFRLDNPWYGPMDAHLLFAIVRDLAPPRVLELGSGYSTLVIQGALSPSARHDVVDPVPSPLLRPLSGALTVRAESAATVSDDLFDTLSERDILFVDTSHTVRPGGEVVRIVLEVLPRLKRGVVVHVHDFFRPFAYPRVLYELFNVHWQEQYLLQALLAYNPRFEVLFANHALWRLRRERVKSLFPDLREGMEPSGLWLRRV
jgi:Methyltransferase domain